MYQSKLQYDESVELEAGETKLLNVISEVKKDIREPQEHKQKIFRVDNEYADDELPLPQGFEVNIEPARFTVYPNTTYESTITIRTTKEIPPGEYFLKLEKYLGNLLWMACWIKVTVQS